MDKMKKGMQIFKGGNHLILLIKIIMVDKAHPTENPMKTHTLFILFSLTQSLCSYASTEETLDTFGLKPRETPTLPGCNISPEFLKDVREDDRMCVSQAVEVLLRAVNPDGGARAHDLDNPSMARALKDLPKVLMQVPAQERPVMTLAVAELISAGAWVREEDLPSMAMAWRGTKRRSINFTADDYRFLMKKRPFLTFARSPQHMRALMGVQPQERISLAQITRAILGQMIHPPYSLTKVFGALAKIPEQERADLATLIQSVGYVRRSTSPCDAMDYVCEDDLAQLIENLASVPKEERAPLMALTQRLATAKWSFGDYARITHALSTVASPERESVLEDAGALAKDLRLRHQEGFLKKKAMFMGHAIFALAQIPKEERPSMAHLINTLARTLWRDENWYGPDCQNLILALGKVVAPERESVATLLNHAYFYEVAPLIQTLATIPHVERASVVTMAEELTKGVFWTSSSYNALLKTLQALPAQERAHIVALTQDLARSARAKWHEEDYEHIFRALMSIPPEKRSFTVRMGREVYGCDAWSVRDVKTLGKPVSDLCELLRFYLIFSDYEDEESAREILDHVKEKNLHDDAFLRYIELAPLVPRQDRVAFLSRDVATNPAQSVEDHVHSLSSQGQQILYAHWHNILNIRQNDRASGLAYFLTQKHTHLGMQQDDPLVQKAIAYVGAEQHDNA